VIATTFDRRGTYAGAMCATDAPFFTSSARSPEERPFSLNMLQATKEGTGDLYFDEMFLLRPLVGEVDRDMGSR